MFYKKKKPNPTRKTGKIGFNYLKSKMNEVKIVTGTAVNLLFFVDFSELCKENISEFNDLCFFVFNGTLLIGSKWVSSIIQGNFEHSMMNFLIYLVFIFKNSKKHYFHFF